MSHDWIEPAWRAPPGVRAVSTTRAGGVSRGRYSSFNLGTHVGDDPSAVAHNRRELFARLGLPGDPLWLHQVHGAEVVTVPEQGAATRPVTGDGAIALVPTAPCVVLTADCLPVLFCDRDGTRVAAAHCGWRGLAAGILEATVAALEVTPDRLLAWLGPAIGPDAFEVGEEVRQAFLARDAQAASAFRANERGRWQADLYRLAHIALARMGVRDVSGGGWCCHGEDTRFFSHRRDGVTGRMATLIWLAPR
jgi:purine-nucleoside/S-methyl-5'-thioadenosine phosphorylase / adenosine deaminase